MTRTVWIRNADWVVAWDPSKRHHAYLEHGDVVFAGNSITFVGRGYPGAADETIDGRGLMVMPGLVNVHAHPGHEASYRGIREEHGVPEMYMSASSLGSGDVLEYRRFSADRRDPRAPNAFPAVTREGRRHPLAIQDGTRSAIRRMPGSGTSPWRSRGCRFDRNGPGRG